MIYINEQYITDNRGHKSAVIIPFTVYQKIMDILDNASDLMDFKLLKRERSISYDKYRRQRLKKSKNV